MPLQKQLVQLPFSGLQTKVDPKIAATGSYETINNFIMNRYPELVKRDGVGLVGVSTSPSNIISAYNYLNEVGVITNNSIYAYVPSTDQYQKKGATASPIASAKTIIANTYTQSNCDSDITASSILGAVWEDSRGGVRCSIKDLTTDTFIVSDYNISATGVKPKVTSAGNFLLFSWVEASTTTLKCIRYNISGSVFSSINTINASLSSNFTYDCIPALNHVAFAFSTTAVSPDTIVGCYWNINTNTLGTGTDGLPTPLSLAITNSSSNPVAISLAIDPTDSYIVCTVYNSSKQVYTKSFTVFLAILTSELQVSSATTDVGYAITSCVDSLNNTHIFYSSFNSLHNSFQALVTSNVTTPAVSYNRSFYLQMGLASKAFWYSGNAYVILSYVSSLQQTFFGVRDDGACYGRFLATLAGGMPTKSNSISSFNVRPDRANTFVIALPKTTKIVVSTTSYNTTTSIFTEQINFTPNTIDNKVLGKSLNIAGGYLKQYDGSDTIFEQGFHIYPEQPSLAQSTTGSIANGTYSYIACWEWVDNQGQLIRSTPSIPTTVTTTGSNGTVTITVRTLSITNKETRWGDTRTAVVLAIYRTLTLGTTYYRVNQLVSEYVYNDPTTQTIVYTDTKADTSISSNSLIYTTGSVFDNITLPSVNLMSTSKNRIIAAGTDTEPNRVYYSKEKEEGIGIEFSNELSFIVDGLGGDITAVATMDDKIVIFKKSLAFYVSGQGMDKVGTGSFTTPQLISADCGCIYPQSIVLTGKGIMFQSQKGIYLIDQTLNITYVGQAIDVITTKALNFQMTSAINLPDQNQVFFTDTANRVLVYDTYFDQWYTHTFNFSPVSATILGNNWYVTSSSNMYKQIPNQPYDGTGDSIVSTLKTNWININQMEGFGRIYAIMLLGDNANLAHTLKVNLYYDFKDEPGEILSITPTNLAAPAYGIDSPYGSGTPYGGSFDGTYQFVIRPKIQKCSSIQIEIIDSFPDGSITNSYKFTGLSLVVGIKSGWNKGLSYTRRLT